MRTFDRVVLVVLALGIWALVLKPTELTAHGAEHSHDGHYAWEGHRHTYCTISGTAGGVAYSRGSVDVRNWRNVEVNCM